MQRSSDSVAHLSSRGWAVAEWTLLFVWVLAGVITMYPAVGKLTHLHGTLFTAYAADLTNPAWLYIVIRKRSDRVKRWFASTPELAAGSIFVAGVLTELSQKFWPNGMFAGRFDPFDIVAFGVGLFVCYLFESLELRRQPGSDPGVEVRG